MNDHFCDPRGFLNLLNSYLLICFVIIITIIRISITLQSVSCISNRLAVTLFGEIAVFFDNSSSF